jgi:CRP-like cAMP-binding protein
MLENNHTSACQECAKGSICFKQLLPGELNYINDNKVQLHYKAGEHICKQGTFASNVLYIKEGLVKIYLEGPNDKCINVRIARTSEFIGLSGMCGNNIFKYSAQALKDSDICMIEKESLKDLIKGNGEFASEIVRWYCEKEEENYEKIMHMGFKQMHARFADILLYLDARSIADLNVFNYLSRKDLADFLCVSGESVVRLLTEFKKEGLIATKGKMIEILKPEKLQEYSRKL